MTLLSPAALALAALAVPIVLMYVLKLRRRTQDVSSLLLWSHVVDDVQANAPWQRLRPNILLLLQILALLALVGVLAQPAYTRAHTIAGDLVLIVDESYGMQARDVLPSRFDVARQRAHALASNLSGGNVISVIGMGAQPSVAIAESDDKGAIDSAIDSLRPTVSAPNFLAAASLATSLARSGTPTRVMVLTSRQSGIRDLPLEMHMPVQIVRIGRALRDLAITSFSVKPVGSSVEALVRVSNFGSTIERSDLDLLVDGRIADVRPISVAPGAQSTLFWTTLPGQAQAFEARLTASDSVTDDKRAWAVQSDTRSRRVLLVGTDYFLQSALAADPSLHVTTVSRREYSAARARRFDLEVWYGALPSGNDGRPLMLVDPPSGTFQTYQFGSWRAAGAMVRPAAGDPGASLLQNVDVGDVHVARARAVRGPGLAAAAATTDGRTLLAIGDTGASRIAILPFNLDESDWPLRISFPIAVQTLAHWLAPGLSLSSGTVAAGSPVRLLPRAGTRALAVTRPDGARTTLRPPFPPFADTSHPGIYSVREVGVPHPRLTQFAVNFFPARPAPVTGPATESFGHASGATRHTVPVLADVAWAFWILAMAILSAEWWAAFRR